MEYNFFTQVWNYAKYYGLGGVHTSDGGVERRAGLAGWVGGKGGKVREGWMSGEGEELRQGVGVRLELRWDKLGGVEVLANQIFSQPIHVWMWRGLMCGCLCV